MIKRQNRKEPPQKHDSQKQSRRESARLLAESELFKQEIKTARFLARRSYLQRKAVYRMADMDLGDLTQVALMGLDRAERSNKPGLGFKFSTVSGVVMQRALAKNYQRAVVIARRKATALAEIVKTGRQFPPRKEKYFKNPEPKDVSAEFRAKVLSIIQTAHLAPMQYSCLIDYYGLLDGKMKRMEDMADSKGVTVGAISNAIINARKNLEENNRIKKLLYELER